MSYRGLFTIAGLVALCPLLAVAQTDDVAEQRGQIASQRIQAEADRRSEEEQASQEPISTTPTEPAVATTASTGTAAAIPEPAEVVPAAEPVATGTAPADTAPAEDRASISAMLEQLRELGALRDAGHVTDEEFEQIKARILEAEL